MTLICTVGRDTAAWFISDDVPPEELQEASMHTTNKAFKRYYQKAGRAAIKISMSRIGEPPRRGGTKGTRF